MYILIFQQTIIVKPPISALGANEPLRMTRRTVQEIEKGTLFFKLGQEGTFKSYINQFTSNPSALSRVQANEERSKRTHMSHKFSLTDASVFKWMGQLHGTRNNLVNTLRQTILQLESNLPVIFMHANWHLMRKPWIQALTTSNTPKELARALTVLQCCIKPALMVNVWYDSLGHTALKKITQQMKDDKKKIEKRERKELEEEIERLRPFMTWVKYTLGLKHQVSKQRGEEYRAHGQQGWLWLASTRRFTPCDARTQGLRAGPHRLAVKYTDLRNNSFKIVLMEPKAFKYLVAKQETLENNAKENNDENIESNAENTETESKIGIEKKKLEQALKNAKLEHQVPEEEMFKDVVDVSAALSNPTRVLYPKVAKKTQHLDDFLNRRLQLKSLEERRIELKYGKSVEVVKKEGESDTKTSITSDLAEKTADDKEKDFKKWVEQAKKNIWNSYIPKLNEAKIKTETDDTADEEEKPAPEEPKCYSVTCSNGKLNCYSVTCPNKVEKPIEPKKETKEVLDSPVVKEIISEVEKLIKEAAGHGLVDLKSDLLATDTPEEAADKLKNLVKNLMKTKDDADNDLSIGISTVANSTVAKPNEPSTTTKESENGVNGDVEKNINRTYSNKSSAGKLYLKRIQTVAESKKQSKIIKYPLAPSFYAPTRKKRSILILAKHDYKRLARRAGFVTCEGFNYNSKSNNQVWPYPCPRPCFKTAWLFRTASLNSFQTVAMQVRILWACLRWDDLHTKYNSVDGKHQETSDSAIITTEIIKHRHTGRFQEITEYYQRKVTIPLNMPTSKSAMDNTPIRSGLRKRKREEAPVKTEPEVLEQWIPEEKLELWEVRAYRDKLERDRNAAVTRTRTGAAIREPQRLDPGLQEQQKKTDMKAKMEEQLKSQQNRSVLTPQTQQPQQPVTTVMNSGTATPTIIRRVQNPDGTVSIIRTTMGTPATPTSRQVVLPTQPQPQQQVMQPGTKKVFLSKDGKIIGAQLVQQPQPATPNTNKISIPSVGGVQNPAATPTQVMAPAQATPPQQTQQKVQIVRSADGKIQVRGLLPGQQLVQMPDGKLQIFSQPPPPQPQAPQIVQPQPPPTPTLPVVSAPQQPQPSRIVVHPSGASSTVTSSPKPTIAQNVSTPPKSIVATPLQPGQAIPPGTTVFMSGGKTYCIPKAQMTIANQHQQSPVATTTTTPALPMTPLPPQQLTNVTPTPQVATTPQPTATPQKQMVEVKSLGQNTVTVKGNQMIVSGPDIAQAQQIAKQLSSGAAKLATLNGKQVLISTQPTVINQSVKQPQTPQQPATVTQVATPTTTPSATTITEIPNNIKLPSEPLPQNAIKNDQPVQPQPQVQQQQQQQQTQVTAQLIQTPQGPRIVLQGLQGANLNEEQLQSIQRKVKEQLLKAQAEAKLQGKVPPTKIAIHLPPNFVPTTAAPSPATPTVVNPVTPATPKIVAPVASTSATPTTTRQVITTASGQRVILMGNASGAAGQVTKQIVQLPPNTEAKPSLLMNTLTSPPTTPSNANKATPANAAKGSPEKFELTQDYIQQTIQQALKKDNLSPEIEQKLLALQQQNISDKSVVIRKNSQKMIDPATGEPMDDEWEGASTAERSIANKNKRKKLEENVIAERQASKRTPSSAALARSGKRSATPTSNGPSYIESNERMERQKLQQALLRHKEQLKRDITKKRSMQEKELQTEIQKQIEAIKGKPSSNMVKLTASAPTPPAAATAPQEIASAAPPPASTEVKVNLSPVAPEPNNSDIMAELQDQDKLVGNKRKRHESDENNESNTNSNLTENNFAHPPKPKKKRRSSGQNPSVKKDKLYCICKTRYDPKK